MNACTDQLVMMLVPKDRIASVSYLAVDPDTSVMADQAQGLRLNHGLAEEILPLKPDLVVAGRYSARAAVNLLKKLGFNVLDMEPETSLQGFRDNLRIVARAVGEEDKAERIIADFDARLERLEKRASKTSLIFANYGANGMTSGAGTMVADVAHHAGMTTLGEELGFAGTRIISLEQLLASAPDIIDADIYRNNGPARANENFRHPAFRVLKDRAESVSIPTRYWVCGTPKTLDALETLIDAAEDRAP
jgi:iron complex transport system substrate-binding protein